jgi:predicted protein tyrosine phosphatase
MKLLFVCSKNQLRSPTAEAVFSAYPGIEALSAGTSHDAETPLTEDLIEWADVILVMEQGHREKVAKKFMTSLKNKRLMVLGIPDKYEYMAPELVRILKAEVSRLLRIPLPER